MRHSRRPGLSLTEVLVAMFVMALGLMALLTLFPLGAMQIGQALKDDRTAQAARQADAWLRAYWRAESKYEGAGGRPLVPRDGMLGVLDDPNLSFFGSAEAVPPGPGGPRYSLTLSCPFPPTGPNFTLPARPGTPNGFNTLADAANTAIPGFTTFDTAVAVFRRVPMPPLTGPTAGDGLGTRDTMITPQSGINPAYQRFIRGDAVGRSHGPSYPLLIDPVGWLARVTNPGEIDWVGYRSAGTNLTGAVFGVPPQQTPVLLPRRNPRATHPNYVALEYRQQADTTQFPAFPTLAVATQRAFATAGLSDDLSYQPNGGAGNPVPALPTTTEPLNRQGRYTWAAVVQRPHNSDLQRATLTVLVFDGRPVNLAPAGDEVVLTNAFVNTANPAAFNPGPGSPDGRVRAGDRSIRLNVPARGADRAPLVRRGGWVALAALEPLKVPGPGGRDGVRTVSFHRITGLTTEDEVAVPQFVGSNTPVATTPVTLDLDRPVPAEFAGVTAVANTLVATGPGAGSLAGGLQVILLAGLSEVFERPDLTP